MHTSHDSPELPHWRLDQLYPGLDSEQFARDFNALSTGVGDLTEFFDSRDIGIEVESAADLSTKVHTLEEAIIKLNALLRLARRLGAYVRGHTATDSRNTQAQIWMSRLQIQLAELEKLEPRFTAWVGELDLDTALTQSEIARAHSYALRRAQTEAQHLMSPAEEALAADLNLTGGRAWSTFYNNYSSQIVTELEIDGETRRLPITAIRNLAYEPNRELRRRAYEVELAAWEANAMPIASALNSIKGQANTLNQRRGWKGPLDLALFNNAIDRATLDAMMGVARDHFPHFRRYLRAKSRVLGIEKCAWYDLFAPVGGFEREWSFKSAKSFIVDQFASFSSSLSALARRAFDDGWIDAEPRDGKRGGAFCMYVRDDESRILTNYQQSYGGVSTLAHELGHAFHNFSLAERTQLQRRTPMTLAETASTFCQIIVRNAALREATDQERLAILEADLQDATQVVVDITSRFHFEAELFSRRASQELSVEELCGIMTKSQQATYGDGLDTDHLHPYMWAVKPHYYGAVFYNFPYMFGLLFGLGIYARYRENPQGFVARYESLLSSTGMASAADLAARFGFDVTRPSFWEDSLALIVEDIDRFEQLVETMTA
ncbi:MAG: M3 family oligoendopeptidase [Anaerolineae bacterium]